MSKLTRGGTAEPVSRDQILRREQRGQGNIHFPRSSADHVQDWQPYPVDPYSCSIMCDHTLTCILHNNRYVRMYILMYYCHIIQLLLLLLLYSSHKPIGPQPYSVIYAVANPVRGHKEVPRSRRHIMVTTRYSDQQGSKSRQKVMRLYKRWHRPITKRFIKPPLLHIESSLDRSCSWSAS